MEIRVATKKDLEQLNHLKGRSDTDRYLKRIGKTNEGSADYLVLEENGEILGHVFLKYYGTDKDPDYPNVEDLYIRKDQRGKGLGTKLLEECERLSKEKGFNKIGISVNPTLNQKAVKLYQRLGYKDLGRGQYLDGVYDGTEDWVIDMVKEL